MDPSYFDPIREEYQARRDTLFAGLTASPGRGSPQARGRLLHDREAARAATRDDFARWLLTDWQVDGETVMVAPGDGFYATPGLGQDEIRVAYVLETEKLDGRPESSWTG